MTERDEGSLVLTDVDLMPSFKGFSAFHLAGFALLCIWILMLATVNIGWLPSLLAVDAGLFLAVIVAVAKTPSRLSFRRYWGRRARLRWGQRELLYTSNYQYERSDEDYRRD